MKHLLSFFLVLSFFTFSSGQKINVSQTSETIEKIPRTGLAVIIALDEGEVEDEWKKQLKNYGKVESSKGVYTIAVANIPSVSSSPCRVTSIVKGSGKGSQVWWTIDLGNSMLTSNSSASKAAEKILHDFAILCYKDDINNQIKEAEKALAGSVKNQEKETKEGQDLVKDVEKNKQEKINLEQKIVQNGKDLEQLQKDIAQNKTDQGAAAAEVEKMKKAVEVVKQKLNTVDQ
jgi:archaellum component FlaG (FlaF/FlaG flagellin family)